ncbi:MAG: hypothetical protein ACYTF1_19200, partial [Planctomycetota bacterium]
DWGIEVYAEYRIIRGERDAKHTDRFAINVQQWGYMQLNGFTDHPIGKPLKARRMLMSDVCPVTKTDNQVQDITVDTILELPLTKHNIWAENGEGITRIFTELRSGKYNGAFIKNQSTAWDPPFSVILSAANSKTGGKIVVMGTGISLAEFYIQNRVPRFEGDRSKLVTDPPPRENLDLFLNTLYSLSDKEELIAAGPASVRLIEPIANKAQRTLWLTSATWSLLVVVVGGLVLFVRRK